jgi:biotin transporter BioY
MRLDPNSQKLSFLMIILGGLMTVSAIGTFVILAYCLLIWQLPTATMVYFILWTVIISVSTWRLDAHLIEKEKKQ